MKLRHLTPLAATAALLVSASSAAAQKYYPTAITHDSSTQVKPHVYLEGGQVKSPKRACEVLRVVKVIARGPYVEPPGLLEFDVTSAFGAWSTKDRYTGAESVKAIVTEHRFRVHGKRITCRRASVKLR